MATNRPKKDDDKPVVVDLIHPDGVRHYEASTPRELYNLVSGAGYSIAENGLALEDAAERLAVNVSAPDVAGAGAAPAPGTTTNTSTTTGTAT